VSNEDDDEHQPDGVEPAAPRAVQPPHPRRARLRGAIRGTAVLAGQLLVIAAALLVLGYVLSRFWSVLLPVILGLLVSTVLWPSVRFLRAHKWPPAAAAAVVLLGFLALLVGAVLLIVPPVVDQSGDLADRAGAGLTRLQEWLTGPPLDLGEDQIGEVIDSVVESLKANTEQIAGSALSWVSSLGSGIVNAVLALVLAFFFIKDGPKWLPWLTRQTGHSAGLHVARLSERSWDALSKFIRQQAFVGFIDAFFIGLGLWIVGVPLVLPLSVLTFFAAFVPYVGAFVAGGFAVLVALVSRGPTTALIVLGIVVLVQQLEGNVLEPVIQGRGLDLHPAVVILAVTAGGSLAGITGAFLAVPTVAVATTVYRYARDQLNGVDPDTSGNQPRPR
jgi:predicted PurR-regulated permease PerM